MPIAGTLTWTTKNQDVHIELAFDKIALVGSQLVMLSAVGANQECKAMRAGLNSKNASSINMEFNDNFHLMEGDCRSHTRYCFVNPAGYHAGRHYLGCDASHVLFLAKVPGLIFNSSDEALWQELRPPVSSPRPSRFSTPMIREWVPYLKRRLINEELLKPGSCCGCDLWYLTAQTKDLDTLVSEGVIAGELKIEQSKIA